MEDIKKTFLVALPESLIEKLENERAKYGGSRNALIQRILAERYEEQQRQERERKQVSKAAR